jgi:predicted transcriptional regulator
MPKPNEGAPPRREMGELEADILAQLWAAPDSMIPAEVRAAMGNTLAYTTVLTILTRLWQKGLVVRDHRGRAYAYSPAFSEAELAARRMRAALDRTRDREAALSRFVGTLSKRDERALRRVLIELDKEP